MVEIVHLDPDQLSQVMQAFERDLLEGYTAIANHGGVVQVDMDPPFILPTDPRVVKAILRDSDRFPKDDGYTNLLKPLLHDGLFMTLGQTHRDKRDALAPIFHGSAIKALAPIFVKYAVEARDRLLGSPPFDLSHEMTQITLRTLVDSLFGANIERSLLFDVGDSFLKVSAALSPLLNNPEIAANPEREPEYIRYVAATDTLYRVVDRILESHDSNGESSGLIKALRTLGDGDISGDLVNFLLAGHETSAAELTWGIIMAAQNKEVNQRLQEEYARILGGRDPTAEDFTRLVYTRQFLEEVLRMYPAGWQIGRRKATEDSIVEGCHISRGTTIVISPYAMHHSGRFWNNPETFDPDRKASRNVAYMPWGESDTKCIGMNFALWEMTMMLPVLTQNVRYEIEPDQDLSPHPGLSLRTRGKVMATAQHHNYR